MDNTVRNSQGDMMLCPACEIYRFPYLAPSSSGNNVADTSTMPAPTVPITTTASVPSTSPVDDDKVELVVCELLYCAINAMDRHPMSTIKSVIYAFYRDDEIVLAKQKLIAALPDSAKAAPISQYMKKRIGDNKRKASADDILGILSAVDENGLWGSAPKFCAVNRSRVAEIPDEMSDMTAIRHELKQVRDQLEHLTSKFMSVCGELSQQRHTQAKLSGSMIVNSCDLPNSRDAVTVDCCTSDPQQQHDVPAAAQPAEDVTTQSEPDDNSSVPVTYADMVERIRDEPFQQVTRRKPRKDNQPSQDKTAQSHQLVVGRSTSNTLFKGVVKKAVVCVNRLNPDVSTDVVSDFLKENSVNVHSCHIVRKNRPTEQDNKSVVQPQNFISMRLCVSQHDLDKIYDTNLWPDGVVVRPWTFKTKIKVDTSLDA